MALAGGAWGYARWGGSLWGFKQSGVSIGANLINAAVIAFLAQTTPAEMKISFSCTIGGVDKTAYIASFRVEAGINRKTAYCELIYAGESVSGMVLNSTEIILSISYSVSGTTYTGTLFKGKPANIIPQTGLSSQSVQIICFDAFSDLDKVPSSTSWTGNTDDLAALEASLGGVTMLDFDFTGIALSSATINQSSRRTLIKDLAEAIQEIAMVSQPDGALTVRKVSGQQASGWTFPLTNQLSQGVTEATSDRYNSVTVTGSTGNSSSYTDASDVATCGLLDTTITSPWALTTAQALLKATAKVNYSILPAFTFQTIINPWLRAGTVCTAYVKKYSANKSILIERITSTGTWENNSGFWATVEGKIIA